MNRINCYSQLADDITNWIRTYAESNNIRSLVIGVSGGIDSAVVSTLCARTGLPVTVCSINIGNSIAHIQIAESHMKWLSESYSNVWREFFNFGGYDFWSELEYEFEGGTVKYDSQHAYANTKSRFRMMTLYHVATCIQGIVVGTGNKVEDFGVGFYTKYGDGGVDISPIADLYKTEVRELGRYLGVSWEILDAAPTDGLWADGRTDEQQIGATYEELEWAMNELSDDVDTSLDHTSYSIREEEVLLRYTELHNKNQHKMQPIPVYKINSNLLT